VGFEIAIGCRGCDEQTPPFKNGRKMNEDRAKYLGRWIYEHTDCFDDYSEEMSDTFRVFREFEKEMKWEHNWKFKDGTKRFTYCLAICQTGDHTTLKECMTANGVDNG